MADAGSTRRDTPGRDKPEPPPPVILRQTAAGERLDAALLAIVRRRRRDRSVMPGVPFH